MSFKEDLAKGEVGEKAVIDYYSLLGCEIVDVSDVPQYYDLGIDLFING